MVKCIRQLKFIPQALPAPSDPLKSGRPLNCGVRCKEKWIPMTEPLFRPVHAEDSDMNGAYAAASASISEFQQLVQNGDDAQCMAKLRFRDPDLSDQMGEDRFLYLWLSAVIFHSDDGIFSGEFFEVPREFQKWHQVGQRLGFDPEDVFDWMVIEKGRLRGGFTIRITRSRLKSDEEKAQYDEYIGVSSYEPVDF